MPETSNESKRTTRRSAAKKTGPLKLKSVNPATGEVMGEVTADDPASVADAVAVARKVAPEWAAIPPGGRARMLREVRHEIYNRLDEIVATVSEECGKPMAEALTADAMATVLNLLYYERTAAKVLKPQRVGRFAGPALMLSSSHIEWRPHGVVGCISPWNYPFFLSFMAIAPALFAGNTVVLKPSEVTPRVGELIRQVLEPLPSGVATVIQGGGDVGAALVNAPCDKIAFIGSPGTGRHIAEAAAKHLTPVVMELGGQDTAIVCSDADLDHASSGVLWGAFVNSGQTCAAIERAYVVDSVADEFERKLVSKVKEIRQGEDVGALTAPRQFDVVQKHVLNALDKGANLLAGGPDAGRKNSNGSHWYAPTIIEGRSEEMDIFTEETFGPVLPIIRVRDEEEAVARARDEGYNLTASVWTKNKSRANLIASQLRAGIVMVNDHASAAAMAWGFWGGVGESGYGRLNGELGLKEMSVPVHIARNVGGLPKLWWYPYDDATNKALRAATELLSAPGVAPKAKAVKDLLTSAGTALKNKL